MKRVLYVPFFIKKFHIWLLRHGYPSNITYKFQPVLSVRFDWKYLQYVLTLVFRRLLTVWKLLDFYVIQILREIKFGESRSFKTAVFALYGTLDFVYLVNFSLQKVQKFLTNQNSEPLNVLKWQILHFKNPKNWFHVKSEW